ncbi:MAG: MBL fold metallo-hydrolase, partial [Candidatus Aenigmarchaeota archaeon]|nr:MBL fold metallo-hydrolase [Candidatus Aenigmarchaeota archaeon]
WVGLFDCGEGTQRQIFRAKENFMRISDIFISHWHADHFAGLLGLIFTMNMEKRQKELRIYGPEADRWVDAILNLGYARLNFPVKKINVEHEGTGVETILDSEEFLIQSTPAKHGIPAVAYAFVEKPRIKLDKELLKKHGLPAKGALYKDAKEKGYVIFKGKKISLEEISKSEGGKKVVYSGDTLPAKTIIELAKNADLLIHDATFFEEDFESKHSTADEVLEIAKKANAKRLLLTHISRRYSNYEELEKKIKDIPNVALARDMMRIEV